MVNIDSFHVRGNIHKAQIAVKHRPRRGFNRNQSIPNTIGNNSGNSDDSASNEELDNSADDDSAIGFYIH